MTTTLLNKNEQKQSFFQILPTAFAACSKPPSRDNHRKASYPSSQQRHQGGCRTQIMQSGSSLKRHLYRFGYGADRASATGAVRRNSIPGRVKPNALKFAFTSHAFPQQLKGQCEACSVRDIDRWQLEWKTETSVKCLLAKANS